MANLEVSIAAYLSYTSLRMVTVAWRSPVEKRPKISTIVASERGTVIMTETSLAGLRGGAQAGPWGGVTTTGSQAVIVKVNPLNPS